jgi:hypothetical protein
VIYAVAGVAFVAVCHWLVRRIGVLELAAGTLLWWTLLALLLVIGEPLFSSVALWPLLGGVAAAAVVVWVSHRWARVVLLALAALPGLVLLVPLLILEALNVEQGPLVAVPVLVLLLGSLLPQLVHVTGQRHSGHRAHRLGLSSRWRGSPNSGMPRQGITCHPGGHWR